MKILLTLILIAGVATPLFAQEAAPAASPQPLPPGPLVKPFPSQLRWMITRKNASAPAEENAKGTPGDETAGTGEKQGSQKDHASRFNIQIVGEKVGDVSHTITTYSNGRKTEVWKIGGQQTTMQSGWKEPVVSQAVPDTGEDVGWISASNFTGIHQVLGQKCMVFRDKVIPENLKGAVRLSKSDSQQRAQANGPLGTLPKEWLKEPANKVTPEMLMVEAVAYIDLESRLPMALKMGEEVTTYKYEALPPAYTLNLPADVQADMNARKQEIQATTRRSVLP